MFKEKRRRFADARFRREKAMLNTYIKLFDLYAAKYGRDAYAIAYEYYSHHEPHSTRTTVYSKILSYLESKLVEEA